MRNGFRRHSIHIIGAGIIGLATAWRLLQRGWEVIVIERDNVGAGASSAAAGMLAPTAEVEFDEGRLLQLGQQSLELYPDFVGELEDATGAEAGYREDGTIVVAVDRDESEVLQRLFEYHNQLGLDAEWLNPSDLKEREPMLSGELHSGLYLPRDHQVDPRALTSLLTRAVEKSGGVIRENETVEALKCCDGSVEAIQTNREVIDANRVLLATGAWTNQIEGIPREVLPHIRPVRGQMISVELSDPPLCNHAVRGEEAYLVPKPNRKKLLIGATSEERGFDERMTAGGVFELLRGAWEMIPGIYHQHIEDWWSGFRPVSLNNLPVLGETDIEGLWIASGHGRNGILLAPLTARIMADALSEGKLPETYSDLLPR